MHLERVASTMAGDGELRCERLIDVQFSSLRDIPDQECHRATGTTTLDLSLRPSSHVR